MNLKSLPFKIVIGTIYLIILTCLLWWVFFMVGIENLMDYNFIRSQKSTLDIYKENHFFYLTAVFFLFSVIWVWLLGLAAPILIFAGLIFGTWWGTVISVTATTIGATLLYILAGYFFSNTIEQKLSQKFDHLKNIFQKNELFYFMIFRLVGGGGTPYAIQNILPVLFNMKVKNYFFATFFGSIPTMFVTVAIGAGLGNIIKESDKLDFITIIQSPDIFLPLIAFFIILIVAFIVNKIYFKKQ
tara:strand:+ start:575 stop:1303 length:729 start_codon:yes stop_codon:yes gene_type:complete